MHLFQSSHLEAVCPSCRAPHSKRWSSEWWKHDHYKTIKCQCGYDVFLRTEEDHSGHR